MAESARDSLLRGVSGMNSPFGDAVRLIIELFDDCNILESIAASRQNDQFSRRLAVRTIFAYCEGSVWAMKQMLMNSEAPFTPPLTEAERAALSDLEYSLDDRGEVQPKLAKLSLKRNLLFMSSVFGRMYNSGFVLDLGVAGWSDLQDSIKVRDRITHPKDVNQLEISDEEMKKVFSGVIWLNSSFMDFIEARRKASADSRT